MSQGGRSDGHAHQHPQLEALGKAERLQLLGAAAVRRGRVDAEQLGLGRQRRRRRRSLYEVILLLLHAHSRFIDNPNRERTQWCRMPDGPRL